MNTMKKDRMEMASLAISAASLGVGILALCLNEKGEAMTDERIKEARKQNREADRVRKANKLTSKARKKEKKNRIREYAQSIDYSGPVVMFNPGDGMRMYGLVPLGSDTKEKWVAMEINTRNGKDRQAIICNSMEEAKAKALRMKKAHREGSQQSRDCRQGYARVDTFSTIDVARWFAGMEGKLYRV